MKTILASLLICTAGISTAALAADAAPASATPAAVAKPAPLRRVVAPTVNATRVTRLPDGTLRTDCVDQPNPRAQALLKAARAAQPQANAQ